MLSTTSLSQTMLQQYPNPDPNPFTRSSPVIPPDTARNAHSYADKRCKLTKQRFCAPHNLTVLSTLVFIETCRHLYAHRRWGYLSRKISGLYMATPSPLGWYGINFFWGCHHFQWDGINRPWIIMGWDGNFCV